MQEELKILVVSAAYPPMRAGEASNAHHLCRRLAERGVDVHVLTTAGNTGVPGDAITVHPVMRGWSWLETRRFARFIRHCDPDATLLMYVGGMYNYHPMITFAPTIAKRQLPRARFVTRYESPFAGAAPSTTLAARVGRKLAAKWAGGVDASYDEGTLLRDSDGVIVLCEGHRAVLSEQSPGARERMVVIPPAANVVVCPDGDGVTRRRGRARLGVRAEEVVIAFFGYVYPKKGIETLLEAFRMVRRERRGARLVIIGGTMDLDSEVSRRYWDAMQRLAEQLGVADGTTWTGAFRSDGEEGSLFLRAADVCVLPLLGGLQLNNSSFAAMAAHGVPVVATRGPMLDSAFVDGENVLLCEPRDAEGLAKSIGAVIDSTELRERLRSGVAKLAREWLSWDEAIARTLSLLKGDGLDREERHPGPRVWANS